MQKAQAKLSKTYMNLHRGRESNIVTVPAISACEKKTESQWKVATVNSDNDINSICENLLWLQAHSCHLCWTEDSEHYYLAPKGETAPPYPSHQRKHLYSTDDRPLLHISVPSNPTTISESYEFLTAVFG